MTKRQPPLSPGAEMVAAILAEMRAEGVEPDAKEHALLTTARQLVDRLDRLEAIIAVDGEMLVSPSGVTRVHPAISEHRQVAATLPKVLAGIVVGDSSVAKNPTKQRAAQVRWARRDRERESAELRAAGDGRDG